jgi:hypothetical protein
MKFRQGNRGKSGQALIVTALIIVLLSLSAVYYVIETEKAEVVSQNLVDSNFSMAELGTRNTMISALANLSNYGVTEVLTEDLNRFSSKLRTMSYGAESELSFTPSNTAPYQNGTWISWEQDGSGVSSTYATFTINTKGSTQDYRAEYAINITTSLSVEGVSTGDGEEKNVNVTCTVYDENGPALANDIFLFYLNQTDGSWLKVNSSDNLAVLDFGNGTYFISFHAYSQQPIKISTHIRDTRYIFAMANVTCTQKQETRAQRMG